jgi:hypothetical protein
MSDEEEVEFVEDDEDSDVDDDEDDGLSKFSISSKLSEEDSTVLSGSVSKSSGYILSRDDKLALLLKFLDVLF